MAFDLLLGAVCAAVAFSYLAYVLLRPERF